MYDIMLNDQDFNSTSSAQLKLLTFRLPLLSLSAAASILSAELVLYFNNNQEQEYVVVKSRSRLTF